MLTTHKVFSPPEKEDQVIWRYLDFTKLISLLDSSELYFSRVDQFDDKFEGSLPKSVASIREELYNSMVGKGTINPEDDDKNARFYITKFTKESIAASCWHVNDHESAAMWKLYLKSDEGIAIRSTYKRLSSCLHESEYDLNIGMVNYIDYETDTFPTDNVLYPIIHKRKSFEHERELRALIWFQNDRNRKLLEEKDLSYGLSLKIDLKELIDSIYVSPNAPDWLHNLVQSVAKRYELEVDVHQSKINESPIY